jgi:ATPase family protein associated with various cellular activities (AAA)
MKIPKSNRPCLFNNAHNDGEYQLSGLYEFIFNDIPKYLKHFNLQDYDFDRVITLLEDNQFNLFQSYQILGNYNEDGEEITKKINIKNKIARVFINSSHNINTINLVYIKNNTIIFLCKNEYGAYIKFVSNEVNLINKLLDEISKYYIHKNTAKISLLYSSGGDPSLRNIDLTIPTIDLNINYGKNFSKIHENLLKKLNEKMTGLYIFHGIPGTGKTSYITYLTSLIDRKFIFVPVNQLELIVNPSFIQILLDNPNSILVIEDGEKLVINRENNNGESGISTLLNLSDGILGNALKISVIITYNTNREKIDSALLRKGRLLLEHNFNKLTLEESQLLSDKLGKTIKIKEEMTLADIYNSHDENFHTEEEEERKIGFI